jgi:hypothetical protein
MENFSEKGPVKPDLDKQIDYILGELERFDVHKLRRLAISEHLISSDEVVLGDEKGYKEKIVNYLESLKDLNDAKSRIDRVRTKVENIEDIF